MAGALPKLGGGDSWAFKLEMLGSAEAIFAPGEARHRLNRCCQIADNVLGRHLQGRAQAAWKCAGVRGPFG